nr:MAG TPA: LYSOSOMAL ALPHA-MANNOSIDASE [Caudoviricetes sp.]
MLIYPCNLHLFTLFLSNLNLFYTFYQKYLFQF